MEYTKEYLRELAESIYDLDAEGYASLVLPGDACSTVTGKAASTISSV